MSLRVPHMEFAAAEAFNQALHRDRHAHSDRPTCCGALPGLVAVGMARGTVVVGDYRRVVATLPPPEPETAVLALAVLSDSTYVAVGYGLGAVRLFELARPASAQFAIEPVSAGERNVRLRDGHLVGQAIVYVGFVGARHSHIVSADQAGVVLAHNATRLVVGLRMATRKVVGVYGGGTETLACAVMPLGVEELQLDVGLVAVMSRNMVAVVGVADSQVVWRAGPPRLSNAAPSAPPLGTLAWYPPTPTRTARLAYTFGPVLTVLAIDHDTTTTRVARTTLDEPIAALQWIGPRLVAAITATQRLLLVDAHSLQCLATKDLMALHLTRARGFANAFVAIHSKAVVLGRSGISVGSLPNWADRLVALLKNHRYEETIQLLQAFYSGHCDMALVGLDRPEAPQVRQEGLRLAAAISASITPANASLVPLVVALCVRLGAPDAVLDGMLDRFESVQLAPVFLDALVPLVLEGALTRLLPLVFQAAVSHYASADGELLEQVVTALEPGTLDVDLTVRLCRQNGLRRLEVYAWNAAGEFVTPLVEWIRDSLHGDPSGEVYAYLAHILTLRQFPTDRPLPFAFDAPAKVSLYEFLFAGTAVSVESAPLHVVPDFRTEPAYPYVFLLLSNNPLALVDTLASAFEDPFLNGDVWVLRQDMAEVLWDVVHASEFPRTTHTLVAAFLASQGAKYPQFVRFPDSVWAECCGDLCASVDEGLRERCELGLRLLLGVFRPRDGLLAAMVQQAGYDLVLYDVYRASGEWVEAMGVWLHSNGVAGVGGMVEAALATGKPETVDFVEQHLEELARGAQDEEVGEIAAAVTRHAPDIHSAVKRIASRALQYAYLTAVFAGVSPGPRYGGLADHYVGLVCEFAVDRAAGFVGRWRRYLAVDTVLPVLQKLHAVEAAVAVAPVPVDVLACQIATAPPDVLGVCLLLAPSVCKTLADWRAVVDVAVGLSPPQPGFVSLLLRLAVEAVPDALSLVTLVTSLQLSLEASRDVLARVYVGYACDAETARIAGRQAVGAATGDAARLTRTQSRGWTVGGECAVCGKRLWGLHIPSEAVAGALAAVAGDTSAVWLKEVRLVVFSCRHGYHQRCLENLGGRRGNGFACVVHEG